MHTYKRIYIHIYLYVYILFSCDERFVYQVTTSLWNLSKKTEDWHSLPKYGVATISRLLKLQVSFVKEPYKRDFILHKRPVILRSLLVVATP